MIVGSGGKDVGEVRVGEGDGRKGDVGEVSVGKVRV